MPLITSAATALTHIDDQPTQQAREAADQLIKASLSISQTTEPHPSLPDFAPSKFSSLIETEHARLAAGEPKQPGSGIDLSRYEALDAPATHSDISAWKTTLQKAYASAEYLRAREVNLGLLETYGKNAWLIGNSQLEDELKRLEVDVEAAKVELERAEQARRAVQENAAGEMRGLEEGWRKGVGRMIETQAAAEGLRQEILRRRRQGVS